MPILPLEQFNRLSENRKNHLINNFLKKNNEQLILCLVDCKFYQNNNMNSSEDIFVADKTEVSNLIEIDQNGFIEKLYLITLK